jgi:hypothetical protein
MVDKNTLRQILANERNPNMLVTFVACTDDETEVGYLNEWFVLPIIFTPFVDYTINPSPLSFFKYKKTKKKKKIGTKSSPA